MPPRRTARARARLSSDEIEDQPNTQETRIEDVERSDEDTATARPTKNTNGKSKSKANRNTNGAGSRHEDGGDDEEAAQRAADDRIDVENFKDQPLSKEDAKKIQGLVVDWETIVQKIEDNPFTLMREVGASMAESTLGDDRDTAENELSKIDLVMRAMLDLRAEMLSNKSALEKIQQQIALGNVDDVLDRYDRIHEENMDSWKKKTTRQKYARDEHYHNFKNAIYEVQYPDEAMPPLITLISKEDGDDDDDDDEIVVGGTTQEYKCPLTLQMMTKPVTSIVCHHSFSLAGIREYFGNNKSGQKKCPATGCNKVVTLSDMKPDKVLENKVKNKLLREKRMQAQEDSNSSGQDEVIE